ncbi:MAG: gluconate 2-dehydrogenase subunit 3 family protein [Halioglobus sp.]|nr:gluconate 2-dehydrogenase subunit 3 family protein [Halioglobus sp.]
MDRREFLECAALLVSGSVIKAPAFALSEEQQQYLATADDYVSRPANLFNDAQRRIVAAVAEAIIPRTDTPGAIDAGVPHFIELMVADWFNEQERVIFMAGLEELTERIPAEFGKPYHELDGAEQVAVLERMEAAAADSPWYQPGNIRRAFISDAPFICQLKELTIWGFFTSETGLKQVLRYNPMPMKFDGEYARAPGDTTWAPFSFYR